MFNEYLKKVKEMTDKSTVYILQKDLPDQKAGTRYVQLSGTTPGYFYPIGLDGCVVDGANYPPEDYILNNPDWFLPAEDIEIRGFFRTKATKEVHYYELNVTRKFSDQEYDAILTAIKYITKHDQSDEVGKAKELLKSRGYVVEHWTGFKFKYTEEDMRLCWDAGIRAIREKMNGRQTQISPCPLSFEDYINSLNKK